MSISVVIPNYNGRHLLEKHLPHVVSALEKNDEIIVVDDHSTDDSVAYLSHKYTQVKIVKNNENIRYAKTCNRGIKEAKNEFVLLLNNDVSPEKDIKHHLLPHFQRTDVFAVGCLERTRSGTMSGRSIAHFSRGMFVHGKDDRIQQGHTMWAAGGSMMVRRSYWREIGGMDALYRPAYYEDIDLSYRAWKHGWVVLFEPKARVLHDHESTNAAVFGKGTIEGMSYKNAFLFMWKNVTDMPLMMNHIAWLPYHLLVGGWRTRGRIVYGFFQAILQIFEVAEKRMKVAKFWRISDHEVMTRVHP